VNNERWQSGPPDLETMRCVTAMAHVGFPEEVSIQLPPNLTPVRELLDCSVDDLGGVSPVTMTTSTPSTRCRDYGNWSRLRRKPAFPSLNVCYSRI